MLGSTTEAFGLTVTMTTTIPSTGTHLFCLTSSHTFTISNHHLPPIPPRSQSRALPRTSQGEVTRKDFLTTKSANLFLSVPLPSFFSITEPQKKKKKKKERKEKKAHFSSKGQSYHKWSRPHPFQLDASSHSLPWPPLYLLHPLGISDQLLDICSIFQLKNK